MSWLKKIFSKKNKPKHFVDKDGDTVVKTQFYTDDDDINVKLPLNERIQKAIEKYKLPFDIIVDDNGDILESYTFDGHLYSWQMKKYIDMVNGVYHMVEEFQDSNSYGYRRKFEGLWLTELHYIDDNGKQVYNYIKRDAKKGNVVITEQTDELFKAFGEITTIKRPIEIAKYIDLKSIVYDHRRAFVRNLSKIGDYDYSLQYITSLNPYNDGSKGSGLLNRDNDNLYDCELIKK